MPPGSTIADYLDGIRYRRYSRSVLLERRRLLALAAVCGDDAWLGAAPVDEIVATVTARLDLRAPTLIVIGDADIVRPEHAVELLRLLGGGVPGDLAGLPRSRFAVLPGTTHVTMMERADWLIPMVGEFLDAPVPGAP